MLWSALGVGICAFKGDIMTYKEKLQHPKWQRKRLHMLNLARWRCEICGEQDKTLHVHHIEYDGYKDPWKYKDEDLLVCCEFCHKVNESLKTAEDHLLATRWYMKINRQGYKNALV